MACPACTDTAPVTSERPGVEIDRCSRCRGAWLARGELDQLVERSAATSEPPFADPDHAHGRVLPGGRKRSWPSGIVD